MRYENFLLANMNFFWLIILLIFQTQLHLSWEWTNVTYWTICFLDAFNFKYLHMISKLWMSFVSNENRCPQTCVEILCLWKTKKVKHLKLWQILKNSLCLFDGSFMEILFLVYSKLTYIRCASVIYITDLLNVS